MIFVTVGTHEQQFNRLIEEIDNLKRDEIIKDDVFIQTGFSTYEPKYCEWSKLIPYDEMQKKNEEARIIITHGGPATFVAALQLGKIPVVVPRQFKFDEHVNDHQVKTIEIFAQKGYVYQITEVQELSQALKNIGQFLPNKYQKDENSNILKIIENFIG